LVIFLHPLPICGNDENNNNSGFKRFARWLVAARLEFYPFSFPEGHGSQAFGMKPYSGVHR
jgi:hypothetical protein